MTEHEWFTDHIAEFLAGGLPDEEQLRFEAHRAACAECAKEFESIEQTEKKMTELFADVAPGMGFEQRVLGRLRFSNPLRIHPMIRRAAIAASVAIVLGGFGYVANQQMQNGGLDINRLKVASNLRQTGQAILLYSNENKGGYPRTYYSESYQNPHPDNAARGEGLKLNDQSRGNGGGQSHDEWMLALNHGTVPMQAGKDFSNRSGGWNDTTLGRQNQNLSYGRGEFGFQENPFSGVARDMNFARNRFNDIANAKVPVNADDTALLPPSDGDRDGVDDSGVKRSADQLDSTVTKSGSGVVSVNGENYYGGGTVVSGGRVNMGPIREPTKTEVSTFRSPPVTGVPNVATTIDAPTTPPSGAKFMGQSPRQHGFYFAPYAADSSKAGEVKQQLAEVDTTGKPIQLGTEVALQDKAKPDAGRVDQGQNSNAPPQQHPGEMAPDEVKKIVEREQQHESAPTTQAAIVRKVIRNGDITFEVDSFDSATITITKIVAEEGGYVATTNSEKLPNGKVKGTIVVRIPPDHLDTLVMKLRALGDLKSQNLTAEDVTKQYTDTASELRAARAMEERLLNIIKNSQGQIKDLLAAEKELAVWREKIEKTEGQLRYYDNLVALSTLNISLFERDIKKADVLKETENVDMGVETEDVEASRASAIKAIDDAKGRIVESELKQLDAGQLAAKVVAEIPPDASGPALDRLKQLGRVARLETHREQKSNNDQPPVSGTKIERGETHLTLSLYNLANVAPRSTDNLNVAADDVESAYNAIVKLARDADGRIVTSNLNRQTDQQTSGVVQFEVKSADAETILSKVRGNGEVTRLTVTENPDTNNVTSAKRGFNVTIVSLASLLPREVNNRSLASADVDASYQQLLQTLRKTKARIIVSRIEDQGKGEHNAYVDFEIPRGGLDEIEKALAAAGETYNRSVNAAQDADNVTDSKVQFKLSIAPATSLPAREIDALAVEASDVDSAAQSFQNAAKNAGGRVIDANFSKDLHGQTARLIVEIPYSAANQTVAEAKHLGIVRGSQQSTNQQAPAGEFARARIELTLASPEVLVAPEHGMLASLRSGLATSFAGLMWSLQLIVIGLCLVGPWVVLVWFGVKLLKRAKRKPPVAAT